MRGKIQTKQTAKHNLPNDVDGLTSLVRQLQQQTEATRT
jgi:hypothetical protein